MDRLVLLSGLVLSVFNQSDAGECVAPVVTEGEVTGAGDGRLWTGSVRCVTGHSLVGSATLKCRDGQWSGEIPVCVKLDDCDEAELEDISNGWRTVYRRLQYRGAVHRYHCHKSFSLLGSELAWCDEGGWRHGGEDGPPVCARGGCDETLVRGLSHGQEELSEDGGYVRFLCDPQHQLRGQAWLHCNGTHWSGARPHCRAESHFAKLTTVSETDSPARQTLNRRGETEGDNISANPANKLVTTNVFLILNLLLFGQFILTN